MCFLGFSVDFGFSPEKNEKLMIFKLLFMFYNMRKSISQRLSHGCNIG